MAKARKKHTAAFKSQVALAAVKPLLFYTNPQAGSGPGDL